jgi:hypothetical protein
MKVRTIGLRGYRIEIRKGEGKGCRIRRVPGREIKKDDG